MKAYTCKKLPISIKIDEELLFLSTEATLKFGNFQGLIENSQIRIDLLTLLLKKVEGYKSTQIEGTKTKETEIFSDEELSKSSSGDEILNYYLASSYGDSIIKKGSITIDDINSIHSLLLKDSKYSSKTPGKIRTTQNWIGFGNDINSADFIPPAPEFIKDLLDNWIEYINGNVNNLPPMINVAIAHAQFETIHPYNDGNGRIGRLLIPLHYSIITNTKPSLFVSEVIEQFKMNYSKSLMDFRIDKLETFVKFFLQCVIDQSTSYISRINKINEVIIKNKKIISDNFTTQSSILIHNLFVEKIILSTTIIEKSLNLNIQTIRTVINDLVELKILKKINGKREYIYSEIADILLMRSQ